MARLIHVSNALAPLDTVIPNDNISEHLNKIEGLGSVLIVGSATGLTAKYDVAEMEGALKFRTLRGVTVRTVHKLR